MGFSSWNVSQKEAEHKIKSLKLTVTEWSADVIAWGLPVSWELTDKEDQSVIVRYYNGGFKVYSL